MKQTLALFLIIALTITLSACRITPNESEPLPRTHSETFALMLEHRIPYVSDTTGVGKLLSFLPVFDENFTQTTFETHSDAHSNGLSIEFEPSDNWNGQELIGNTHLQNLYASFLFETIDNLDYIFFRIRTPDALVQHDVWPFERRWHTTHHNQIIFHDGRYALINSGAGWETTADKNLALAWPPWFEALQPHLGETIRIFTFDTLPFDIDAESLFIPDEARKTYLFITTSSDEDFFFHQTLDSPEEFRKLVEVLENRRNIP